MNLGDIKFEIHNSALNLVDYTRHPILHLTDGKGLGLEVPWRPKSAKLKISLKAVARDRNGHITGIRYGDMSVQQLAQLIQQNILLGLGGAAQNVNDTGNTARSVGVNSAIVASSMNFVAGTSTTAAAFTDYALGSQSSGSSGSAAATVNALSGSSFTVTATITNSSGGNITYSEIGETVQISISSTNRTFLLSHTVFTGLVVSNGGTLACTDTWSFS